jgi:hypothetical protein
MFQPYEGFSIPLEALPYSTNAPGRGKHNMSSNSKQYPHGELANEISFQVLNVASPSFAEVNTLIAKVAKLDKKLAGQLESAVGHTVSAGVERGFGYGWHCAHNPAQLIFKQPEQHSLLFDAGYIIDDAGRIVGRNDKWFPLVATAPEVKVQP